MYIHIYIYALCLLITVSLVTLSLSVSVSNSKIWASPVPPLQHKTCSFLFCVRTHLDHTNLGRQLFRGLSPFFNLIPHIWVINNPQLRLGSEDSKVMFKQKGEHLRAIVLYQTDPVDWHFIVSNHRKVFTKYYGWYGWVYLSPCLPIYFYRLNPTPFWKVVMLNHD